jgi:hypothetical protein
VGGEYRGSVWLGLDGFHPFTLGLPQIGTTHAVTTAGAAVPAEAWFQWWVRGQNLPLFPIPFLPVAAGDEIIAMVAALAPALVVMVLKNQTAPGGPTAIVLMAAPVLLPGGVVVEVAGTTAQWIVERPTELGGTALYALPDIERMGFDACPAELQPAPAVPPLRTRRLRGVRLVRMLEQRPGPWRSDVIAPSRKLGPGSAEVDYVGP